MSSEKRIWWRQHADFWRAHHEAWQRSDLNQRRYWEAQGLPQKAFENWRAIFRLEPQPPERKLLYRRRGLSPHLSPPLSPPFFLGLILRRSRQDQSLLARQREGHRRRFSEADKLRILNEVAQGAAAVVAIRRRLYISTVPIARASALRRIWPRSPVPFRLTAIPASIGLAKVAASSLQPVGHMVRANFTMCMKATASPIAAEALRRIADAIEASIRGQTTLERQVARQSRSLPLVTALKAWLKVQLVQLPPKGSLAEAIRYSLTRWDALCVFLNDGRIELDTNTVERAIRPVTLGRKNHLFAGSDGGAHRWATV